MYQLKKRKQTTTTQLERKHRTLSSETTLVKQSEQNKSKQNEMKNGEKHAKISL